MATAASSGCPGRTSAPSLTRVAALLAMVAVAAAYNCASSADCELLGDCVDGGCKCRPGFTGPSCGAVNLAPVNVTAHGAVWPQAGDLEANTTFSWGFTVVYSPADKLYHAAVNVGCCGLPTAADPPSTCSVTVGGTFLAHVQSPWPDRGFEVAGIFFGPTAFVSPPRHPLPRLGVPRDTASLFSQNLAPHPRRPFRPNHRPIRNPEPAPDPDSEWDVHPVLSRERHGHVRARYDSVSDHVASYVMSCDLCSACTARVSVFSSSFFPPRCTVAELIGAFRSLCARIASSGTQPASVTAAPGPARPRS